MCVFNTWQTTVSNHKVQKPEINPKKNPPPLYKEEKVSKSIDESQLGDLKISIMRDYSSIDIKDLRRVNYGPFSWPSLLSSDPMLSNLEQ